jgi:hypothetical protein
MRKYDLPLIITLTLLLIIGLSGILYSKVFKETKSCSLHLPAGCTIYCPHEGRYFNTEKKCLEKGVIN